MDVFCTFFQNLYFLLEYHPSWRRLLPCRKAFHPELRRCNFQIVSLVIPEINIYMNWTRLKMNFTIDRESKNLVKWGNSWRRIFSISNNKSICRTAKHWILAVIYLADKFHFVGKLAVLETKIILVDASVTIFWNYNFEIFRLKIKFRSFF